MLCLLSSFVLFFTDLINTTTFALQNDHLQQFSCVTLRVLAWIPRQNLCNNGQSGQHPKKIHNNQAFSARSTESH